MTRLCTCSHIVARSVQLSSLVPAPRAVSAALRAIPFHFFLVSAPRAGISAPRAEDCRPCSPVLTLG
ncbi:hypothetical protein A2U01_0068678 [Trifolium medium]|uniref:Uncharacterized protein n=1 Tax=Trifolium medium TaxID=97028 RepID=A0A392SHU7_9FABA|nr:hypothetical protein [Trifolium medium]